MRVVLDACVLYPTVMRELLLGAAGEGLFAPFWSARILEEWARAVSRNLPGEADVARVEIALLRARWPQAEVPPDTDLAARLYLPDPDDAHVLACAISAGAGVLVTSNAQDFPHKTLADYKILRRDPDGFLCDFLLDRHDVILRVCERVRARAETLSGQHQDMRRLLKKARLPRLGKAICQ